MTDDRSPVEGGHSPVAGSRGRQMSPGTKLGMFALVGVVALGFVWFNSFYSHRAKNRPAPAQSAFTGGGEQYTGPPPQAMKRAPSSLPPPAATSPLASDLGLENRETPATAPIMAFSGQVSPGATPAAKAAASGSAPATGGSHSPSPAADRSPLAARLTPTALDAEQAAVLAHPNMTITEGTVIPCSLQTAINSELPGLVTCVVPIDIRGATGNVVLLDRGTRIVGQIEGGLLQGQNRVFVDWTRAETPDHVVITLDSPGTDELGRAGLPGAVNNHIWERFGGALMLTLVQGALDAGTIVAAGQGNNNSTQQQAALGFVYAAQSNGQSVANTALLNTINIPPTLTKNQGDTVGLIVAHDLDFSNVYRLEVGGGAATNNGG